MLYPPYTHSRGYTWIYFGENQLSPGSFSFSLLPTGHPRTFQRPPVRASPRLSTRFTLPMGRSLRLRVYCQRLIALFGLAFATAPLLWSRLTSPLTVTPGLIRQKARRHPRKDNLPRREDISFPRLRLIVGIWFQVLLTPLPGFFSPFPHGT